MYVVFEWTEKALLDTFLVSNLVLGLHYSTYNAAVRRDGEYTSYTAGEVNMNQELYDPMERCFATGNCPTE